MTLNTVDMPKNLEGVIAVICDLNHSKCVSCGICMQVLGFQEMIVNFLNKPEHRL